MDYELAKELENAGFPQVLRSGRFEPSEDGLTVVYIPTLSELIEACGEPFALYTHDGLWCAVDADAGNVQWEMDCVRGGEGSTPEEAVARLWLELNKK